MQSSLFSLYCSLCQPEASKYLSCTCQLEASKYLSFPTTKTIKMCVNNTPSSLSSISAQKYQEKKPRSTQQQRFCSGSSYKKKKKKL